MKRNCFILHGPPGCGKGSQLTFLLELLTRSEHPSNVAHFDMGDRLRFLAKGSGELSLKIRSYTDTGRALPFDIICEVWKEFLLTVESDSTITDVILAGTIRLTGQGQDEVGEFLSFTKNIFSEIHVVRLNVSQEECARRLKKRAAEEGRTDDASEKTIANRFEVFETKTLPAILRFSSLSGEQENERLHYHHINGEQPPILVARSIWAEVRKKVYSSMKIQG